jgi:circadian clock protein KaiC
LHFTVIGEPSLKLLRYQQQFSFFDPSKVGTSIHYVNLTHAPLEQGLGTAEGFASELHAAGASRVSQVLLARAATDLSV